MTKLHCLGTAGYHPSETRHTSCFFLDKPSILFDAGTPVFRLRELLTAPNLSILLSHTHLDHVMGLTYFWDLIAPHTPLQTVHLYAQQKKLDAIERHLFHPDLFPVIPPFVFHPLEQLGNRFSLGDAECTWFEVEHPGGAVGFRLDFPDYSIGYVTDTTCAIDAAYWKHIQGVDWLIHECNFTDEPRDREMAVHTGHSWTSEVLQAALEHGIERLILTHLNPMADDRDPLGFAGGSGTEWSQRSVDSRRAYCGQASSRKLHVATDLLVLDLPVRMSEASKATRSKA